MAWIGGIIAGYLIAFVFLNALDMGDLARALTKVVDGQYGLNAAIFGHLSDRPFREPVMNRWLGAALIWGPIAVAGTVTAAYRRRQG